MGTIYVRLGPAVGVITRNKGGARVLPQRCCIGLKRRLCTWPSAPCCRFRTKRYLESSRTVLGALRGSWRTAFTGNRPVTGGFGQGRRQWSLLQEGEMTAIVQLSVLFVDCFMMDSKVMTAVLPVPPAEEISLLEFY